MRGVDRDTASLFFGSVVDFIETLGGGETAGCESRADCGGQSGLAVVNVADGADVAVRLASIKMFFWKCSTTELPGHKSYGTEIPQDLVCCVGRRGFEPR